MQILISALLLCGLAVSSLAQEGPGHPPVIELRLATRTHLGVEDVTVLSQKNENWYFNGIRISAKELAVRESTIAALRKVPAPSRSSKPCFAGFFEYTIRDVGQDARNTRSESGCLDEARFKVIHELFLEFDARPKRPRTH